MTVHKGGGLFGPPEGHVPTEAELDLAANWLPGKLAVEVAKAALAAHAANTAPTGVGVMAVVPMFQPGKTHGIWTVGQEVYTVPGAVFLGANTFDAADCPAGTIPVHEAEHLANELAKDALAATGKPGTTAYALVELIETDGVTGDAVAVFEGF